MKFSIEVKYYHPGLAIGLEDVKNAWHLPKEGQPVQLKTIVYQGLLTYRFPSSRKRISYNRLKKGLVKRNMRIRLPVELLPF